MMERLISDLLDLPEQVHRGDFVLNLSEGVTAEKAERTLADYVVTPQLADAFDNALTFIKAAIEAKSSKAAYLHGSFGSGKSHFMAVLHLLLQGNIKARSILELAGVIATHNGWLPKPDGTGKKVLLVPFNLLGAQSLEQALFGRYVDYV